MAVRVAASSSPAIPNWSAVPAGSSEGTAFLARRIALFGKVVFLLSMGFFLANQAVILTLVPDALGAMNANGLPMILQVTACGAPAAQWLAASRWVRSRWALDALDAGGLWGSLSLYALMGTTGVGGFEQSLILALITLATVVTRAVIIPSEARRTLWVSAVASAPAILATWYAVARIDPQDVVKRPWLPLIAGPYIVLWCLLAVAVATLASRVIYGLAQRVREVMQLGQYTLEEKIGQGGMGVVYRARHALLRRPTAIKLLEARNVGQSDIDRFEREVQATSALTHPHTIAVYDYGRTIDGVFYYAMEYLDGITLEDLVRECGPQPAGRVARVLTQIAESLSEAHAVGLVHRDVKPANVMLCSRATVADFVKVLDFGLAKQLRGPSDLDLSTDGRLVGTPLYVSPEAILGAAPLDGRADLYALGAVGYFLLSGAPPFVGTSVVDVCGKHLHVPPAPLSEAAAAPVPASLEALVMGCLAKRPEERPASAPALVEMLRACEGVEPWTDRDARAWWDEVAPGVIERLRARRALAASKGEISASTSGSPTLAIEVAKRAFE
jgi:eukaryotic-like serine/threonine-protein kinase